MNDNPEPATIGSRIRSCRRYRGMSLETLAGLTGLSKGFLSMVENGQRRMDRRSHLESIAEALQVSITDLTGQPYAPTNPHQARSLASIPVIRTAILGTAFDEQPDQPARSIAELRAAADDVQVAYQASEHATYAPRLAELIEGLHVHAVSGNPQSSRAAIAALVGVYRATFVLAKDLGYVDLAWIAADRAVQATELLDDPAWSALGDFSRANALLTAGARHRALRLAEQAADTAGAALDHPQVMPVYGILHLTAALAGAPSRDPRHVDAHIAEAADIASRTGETTAFRLHFGPTNVAVWRVSIAVERGDGGKAAELARGVDTSVLPSRRRRAHFYADLGRGLAQSRGKDAQALAMFREAEKLAPEQIRTNPLIRETVAVMLQRARSTAGGRDLRGLAYRMGIA
ncbi:helix-turn-helix domain-containing protein [Frankia sp. CiP1_Cm_nod1]|uniref:helix-turn-helix domain-containing protein n=1 Tax=Frankia sp. CiP1_Cm_nod1 TaxID=2897160 RepID=UPI002024FE82